MHVACEIADPTQLAAKRPADRRHDATCLVESDPLNSKPSARLWMLEYGQVVVCGKVTNSSDAKRKGRFAWRRDLQRQQFLP